MNIINNSMTEITTSHSKKVWRTPVLTQLGKFSSLVLGGGGKLSGPTGDPGDPRKPPPTG